MKYNFDTIINRKNTYSLKWDLFDAELPMWVADMDYKDAPEIVEALKDKVAEEVYGYSIIPDEWYEAYINWWKQYNLNIKKEWLKYTTGVMPAISSIIRTLTKENDKILIQTPVYHAFHIVIEQNNRQVIENPLEYNGTDYLINYDDLDEKLSQSDVKLMILCNPHNPVGKIWNKEDLEKIGQLAQKHNVIVVSDEIHCDLTNPDRTYIPFASVSDTCKNNSITTVAPTKTFNIAGLKTAAVIIPDEKIRKEIFNRLDVEGLSDASTFAITGAIAAYNHGKEWLNELRQYLYENKKIVDDYLKTSIPDIKLVPSEATYLLWLDCTKLDIKSKEFTKLLQDETGLLVSPGVQFGQNGDEFLRLNIACPKELLLDGLKRLEKGVDIYKKRNNIN